MLQEAIAGSVNVWIDDVFGKVDSMMFTIEIRTSVCIASGCITLLTMVKFCTYKYHYLVSCWAKYERVARGGARLARRRLAGGRAVRRLRGATAPAFIHSHTTVEAQLKTAGLLMRHVLFSYKTGVQLVSALEIQVQLKKDLWYR